MNKFIVLSSQRSGSTWFMDSLHNIDGINASFELLIQKRVRKQDKKPLSRDAKYSRETIHSFPWYRRSILPPPAFRPFSVFKYLDIYFDYPGLNSFKLMHSQIVYYPEVLFYIKKNQIPIIHLVRRNKLDVIISFRTRVITGTTHLQNSKPEKSTQQFNFEPRKILNQIKRLEKSDKIFCRLLQILRIKHIEIIYEDLQSNPEEFNKVWDFLSIRPNQQIPQSSYKKIITSGHREILKNYNEIKDYLSNTEYSWMLR